MVENFAESLGMCSDGPGSAPNEVPKRGSFLEREQERGKEMRSFSVWRRRGTACLIYNSRAGPTCARHPKPVRAARGRSGTPTRTVRKYHQSIQ
jgi:hypothetical protein